MGICHSEQKTNKYLLKTHTEHEVLRTKLPEISSDVDILKSISDYSVFAPLQGRKNARLLGIIDGDTLSALVVYEKKPVMITVRVSGIDTPEKKGPTREEGLEATKKVYEFFDIMDLYEKKTERQCPRSRENFLSREILFELVFDEMKKSSDFEKYGRYLAKVVFQSKDLSTYMIECGKANPYSGGTKDQKKWEK